MAPVGVATAFAVSLVVCWSMVRLGRRLGFVDRPDEAGLKTHQGTVPPLGGVGVYSGLHAGLLWAGLFNWPLFWATSTVFLVGLVDDRVGLRPYLRLLAAAGAGVILGLGLDGRPESVLFGAVAVVVAVNAVNLLDGLDLLSGSVSMAGALGLSLLAVLRGAGQPLGGLVLAAALVGFLAHNWPPARLFLGDNGAYVTGVALAYLALGSGDTWTSRLAALAVLGVPVGDLVITVARRSLRRASLFAGDRDHTYDRLHSKMASVLAVSTIFAVAQLVWSALIVGIDVALSSLTALVVAVSLWGALTLVIARPLAPD